MFDTICHEHLEYCSSKVIINLCKKNGLRVFDIKQNSINGSSKQYYVCHENSKYVPDQKIINKTINLENNLELTKVKTFQKFKIQSLAFERVEFENFLQF